MKKIIVVFIASTFLFACKQEQQKNLATLKAERAALDAQIKDLESKETSKKVRKSTDVSVAVISASAFVANIDIQAQVTGEQNVLASPQAPGTVTRIFVKPGQHVSSGQVLATLDASALEQQIESVEATLSFARSAYDRLQKLYAQNIGSEIKLLETKAQYESASRQKNALQAQLNMYKIKAPITGTVDAVTIKVGQLFSAIIISDGGNQENPNHPPGKAILEFGLNPHPDFEFDNQGNVIKKVSLNPVEAIIGTKKIIKFPDGNEKEIVIQKFTKLDSLIKFENEGIPKPDLNRGDFYITFLYNYPNSLTDEQEEILSKYVSTINN